MRVALLSDIHGNSVALDAVLNVTRVLIAAGNGDDRRTDQLFRRTKSEAARSDRGGSTERGQLAMCR